jgi:hypothetical protein
MTDIMACGCDRNQVAAEMLPLAMQFAGIVHDESPEAAAQLLATIRPAHRDAFDVVLAALVMVDREPRVLLSWLTDNPMRPPLPAYTDGSGEAELLPYSAEESDWSDEQLRIAHRMHRRGIRDLRVIAGERIYDRRRVRQRRAKETEVAS